MPTDEIPNDPDGEVRMVRDVSEQYRRPGFESLHHHERQFEEAAAGHRWEVERLRQAETAGVPTQTISQMNARLCRLQSNVATDFDEDNEFIFTNSVESAQALEAQREVLSHEAAEDIHRRDGKSLGVMRALEFESHSGVVGQREGFEQTRDYLQRSLNASKEEYPKYYKFLKSIKTKDTPLYPASDVYTIEKDS